MSDSVWVVTIDHKHGGETNVYSSEAKAYAALYEWVCQWWDDAKKWATYFDDDGAEKAVPDTVPADQQEAIQIYFAAVGNEWFEVTQAAVE